MGFELEQMPLFPLHAVLLPYQALPLHIFEERYRSMMRECIEHDRPFGVLLIREANEEGDPFAVPYLVGTSARIITHKPLADGRMDLVAVGERRFRVRQFDRSRAYLVGYVEPIVELEWAESPRNNWLVSRAKDAFELHLKTVFGRQDVNITVQFPDDPVALSFAIAGYIHLPLLEKQRLLELTDTAERFTELIPVLENQALESIQVGPADAAQEYAEFICKN